MMDSETRRLTIKSLKSRGESVLISITGMDQPLLVRATTVHKGKLSPGLVLTASQLQQLIAEDASLRCHRESLRLLGLRDHTMAEMRKKLRRKGFDRELVEESIRKLRLAGLVDDGKFAMKFAKLLLDRKPCGRSYLVAHLRRREISRSLAEQAADVALQGADRSELAMKALEGRRRQLQQLELERARRRAYNYLARRGFSYSEAREAFEALMANINEVNQD
jgi:regulatory protein